MLRRTVLTVVTATVALVLATSCQPSQPAPAAHTGGTAHFTVNLHGDYAHPMAAGFNVLDTGPTVELINSLPAGASAMVWLGNLDNSGCAAAYTFDQFKAKVDALKDNRRVYGFYISDEPHPGTCPTTVADIRSRADYVHQRAPGKKVFIVVENSSSSCPSSNPGCEFAALAPAVTHVDLLGVDSYPCHVGAPCDLSKINGKVGLALGAGIPKSLLVPTYQTFGQGGGYYRLPTPAELQSILDRWHSLLPSPQMDYSYTWGTQGGQPEALSNTPGLEQVMRAFNASH